MRLWVTLIVFLVGVAAGVSGTLLAPRYAGPYLPELVRGKRELVEGKVARKLKEPDRLLLTVETEQGAVLATFKKRVTEIDLLIEQGDAVTLALPRYEPFVEDPEIRRVRKGDVEAPAPAGSGGLHRRKETREVEEAAPSPTV